MGFDIKEDFHNLLACGFKNRLTFKNESLSFQLEKIFNLKKGNRDNSNIKESLKNEGV